MTIPAQFDAKTIEDKWYAYWMENNYFQEPDHRTPYTIVIPPPNVTGSCIWGIC
jgi:valyl-tRNA synthetase